LEYSADRSRSNLGAGQWRNIFVGQIGDVELPAMPAVPTGEKYRPGTAACGLLEAGLTSAIGS
jgi:hypothetical protein